jgi:hypothetical protein
MELFVIYDHPKDFPRHWVVRRWRVTGRGSLEAQLRPTALTETLTKARRHIPEGLIRIQRHPQDDPAIAEVYV